MLVTELDLSKLKSTKHADKTTKKGVKVMKIEMVNHKVSKKGKKAFKKTLLAS